MSAPVQKLSTPVDQVNYHFASPINRKHPNVSPQLPGAPVKFKNVGGATSASSSSKVGGLLSKNHPDSIEEDKEYEPQIPTSVTKTDSTASPSSSGYNIQDREMSTASPRNAAIAEGGGAADAAEKADNAPADTPSTENTTTTAFSDDIQKPPPPANSDVPRDASNGLRGVLRPPPPKTKKASPPLEPQRFTGISPWKYENASWIKAKLANKYFEAAAEAEAYYAERQKLANASRGESMSMSMDMSSPGLRSVASGYGSMSEDLVMGMGGMSLQSPPVAPVVNREWGDRPRGVSSGYHDPMMQGKGSYGGSSSSSGGYGGNGTTNLLYTVALGNGNGSAGTSGTSSYLQQLLANSNPAVAARSLSTDQQIDALLNSDDTNWIDQMLNPSPVQEISDFLGLGMAAGVLTVDGGGQAQAAPPLSLPNPMQLLSPNSAARMMPPPPPPIGLEQTASAFPPPSFPMPPVVAVDTPISPIPTMGYTNTADSISSALGSLLDGPGSTGNNDADDLEAWVNDVVSNSPSLNPSIPPAASTTADSFENLLVEAVLGDMIFEEKPASTNSTSTLNVSDLVNSNNATTTAATSAAAGATDADNFNDLNSLMQNLPEHQKQDMRIRAKQSPFIRNKMLNAQPKVLLDKSTYESADSTMKTPVPVPTRTPGGGNGPLTARNKGRPTFLNLPGDNAEFDRTSSSEADNRIPADVRASSKRKAVSPTGVVEVPPLKKLHP